MMTSRTGASRVRAQAFSLAELILPACIAANASPSPPQDLPEALRARFEAGAAAEKAGRLDEAEKDFQWVLRNGAKAAFIYNNLGIIYQRRRDHARAIAEFQEA